MDAVTNTMFYVFVLSIKPTGMASCAVISFIIFYLADRKLFRAILFSASFPGFFSFLTSIFAFSPQDDDFRTWSPLFLVMTVCSTITFPSLPSGFIITSKCISNALTNKPDFRPNNIYVSMLVLQCVLSVATVYMTL